MGDRPHTPSARVSTVGALLAQRLECTPDAPFAVYPGGRVSFRAYARAAMRFARAVLYRAPAPLATVGLLVHCDTLLYSTALAGTIVAGYTVFPISPRNSAEAVVHLLRATSAELLFVTTEHLNGLVADVKKLLAERDGSPVLQIEELPDFADIYEEAGDEGNDDARLILALREPFDGAVEMYLHSSGSTGMPKPVPYSRQVLASHADYTWVAEVVERRQPTIFGGLSLPTFHAQGMLFHLLYPLLSGWPTAMYAPQAPAPPVVTSPDVALAALQAVRADVVLVAPTFLETWAHDEAAVKFLTTVDVVAFGGGPLGVAASDTLVRAGCTVSSVYGGTEFGPVTRLFQTIARPPGALDWCEFGPKITKRWRADGDGKFELELLRSESHILAVENLPDVPGYATKDLWIPHSSIDGLWRIVGRADDVIMLSTGENIVPGGFEQAVRAHSAVRAALMFGRGRAQGGLLVDARPTHPDMGFDELRATIWPAIEAANAAAPTFARVYPEMVLFAESTRPLPLAPKGTVLRGAALALYAPDIDRLYADLEGGRMGCYTPPPRSWADADVLTWVVDLATKVGGRAIDPDVCLFNQGFDSLSATRLRNKIVGSIRASKVQAKATAIHAISTNIAYATASPMDLAKALAHLVRTGSCSLKGTTVPELLALINKYSAPTASPRVPVRRPSDQKLVVVITGTTGGLGSHLLERCLADPHIERVYALNRPSAKGSLLAKQREAFVLRRLNTDAICSSKVVFVEYITGQPRLGLSEDMWNELRSTATTVIHNAWHLDFNLPLSAFEPHLATTRDLLDLTESSALGARFVFVSSVSAARAWTDPTTPVPEDDLSDPSSCLGLGYSESKYVAAQMVKRRRDAGLDAVTLRVGQIAGSKACGAWSTQDWVPLIIKTGIALGCFPMSDGTVSWLPVDTVVQLVRDVCSSDTLPSPVLNVVHPRPVTWDLVIQLAADALLEAQVTHQLLPLVPFSEWLVRLSDTTTGREDKTLGTMPATKILDFLQRMAISSSGREADSLPRFETSIAQSVSPALDALRPLDGQNVRSWIDFWNAQGWLDDVKALRRLGC